MINKYSSIPYSGVYSYLIVGFVLALSFMGIFANLLTLILIKRICHYKKFSLSLKLTLWIAVVDISACVLDIATHTTRIILGFPKIYEVVWFCSIFSSTAIFLKVVTSTLLGFMAAERYFRICFSRGINRKLGYVTSAVFIIAFAIIAIENSLQGEFTPDPTYTYCLPHETSWALIEFLAGGAMFAILTAILTFCYMEIVLKGYRMSGFNDKFPSRQLSLKALLFLGIYLTVFVPVVLFDVWDLYGDITKCPWIVFAMIPIGMTLIPIINPILVLFLHSHVKKEASTLFSSGHKDHVELS